MGGDKFQDLFFYSGAIAESHFSSGQANDYWGPELGSQELMPPPCLKIPVSSKLKFSFAAENPGSGYGGVNLDFYGNLRFRNRLPSEVLSTH